MSFSANSSQPKNAPNQTDGLRYATLPPRHKPRHPKSLALPSILQNALDVIENWPGCQCKVSLMSICLIGTEQGCWARRHHNRCDCKIRWLPSCLLQEPHGCTKRRLSQHSRSLIPECLLAHPGGCEQRRRDGDCSCEDVPKPACSCQLVQMPCCMASGCPDRKLGHLCDCPRGPMAVCPHMLDEENKRHVDRAYKILTHYAAKAGCDPYDFWATLQRVVHPKEYFDLDLPGKPKDMTDRAEAVRVLKLRAKCRVGLFHPEDRRAPLGEAEQKRQVAYLENVAAFFKQINVA